MLFDQLFKEFPDWIFRHRSYDFDGFLGNWMGKSDRSGMQMNPTIFVGSFESIFQITLDVKSYGCQLRPDLVVPAGMQLNLHQMKAIGRTKIMVGK